MAHLICPTPAIPGAGEAPAIPDVSLAPETKEAAATTAANGQAGTSRAPKSILIIGSGVFGLSTAHALARRPEIRADTRITVVDRSPEPGEFPARDAASIDSSRIIRADYADGAYASLAGEAHAHWRRDPDDPDSLGGDGRYNESGLLLAAENGNGGDGATVRSDGHPTGLGYTRRSWVNALALAHAEGRSLQSVRLLSAPYAIRRATGTGGEWADWGYLNTAAGWADAERSMKWLYEKVVATGRVTFVNGTVEALETQQVSEKGPRVTGARLADGRSFTADLVIVAAGAWTPTIVDLAGSAVATGQCVAYLRITDEEEAKLAQLPVCLNLTDGCFVIPPRDGVLKVARHSYGYLNPQPVSQEPLKSSPVKDGDENSEINDSQPAAAKTISQPRTHLTDPALSIPAEGTSDLRRALGRMIPWLADRPFFKTRLCWYTDTPTGDWIIDYHPGYKNLFVATGGSGHGFKFLPILGDKVVDCLLGRCPTAFREKWKWKGGVGINGNATTNTKETPGGQENLEADIAVELSVVTEDGSRGGKPGLILGEEMAKDGKS
ncbi:FAD dependent oxidoreductase-domain-containing protein [Xylaria sp. FL1777]|nr:FAD dependent oxidoreductase-domain-containing protein [Xylaria sp. FL1777]